MRLSRLVYVLITLAIAIPPSIVILLIQSRFFRRQVDYRRSNVAVAWRQAILNTPVVFVPPHQHSLQLKLFTLKVAAPIA